MIKTNRNNCILALNWVQQSRMEKISIEELTLFALKNNFAAEKNP